MKGFYKRQLLCLFAAGCLSTGFSQTLSEGAKLFKENEPRKAITVLETELRSSNYDLENFNYLGLAYYQTGNFQKAVDTYERGLAVPGTNKKVLYYNQGDAYYALGNYAKACDCYSMSIVADPGFTRPYLNRANAYLKLNDIDKCVSDYETYLDLEPNDPQEAKIRQLLALLRREQENRIAEKKRMEEEALRLKQEEERLAQAKAEQERIAAQKRAEEEERRRQLLEDVANSLKQASDTTNMSAGAEDVLTYDEESDID